MAAVNKATFVKNMITGSTEPLVMLGIFAAGSTTAIKRGEILHLDTVFKPVNADEDLTAAIVIANEEVKAGDRAGYYEVIVPREGDVFEYALATAAAIAVGTKMTYSDSQTVTTGGTHGIGYAVGQEHYPIKQGHLTDDASGDAGTTIRSTSYVRMCIEKAHSYWAALNV